MTNPVPDSDTQEYWDGVDRHELRLQRCVDCQKAVFYPRALCPHCFSDRLVWYTSAGSGSVYAHTISRRAAAEFAAEVPFTSALVDLDDGVRMLVRVLHDRPVQIGDRVSVAFGRVAPGGRLLPIFQVLP